MSDPYSASSHASENSSSGAGGTDDSSELVSLYVKSKKIYMRAVDGIFARWRWALVWLTQIIFYGVPWLQWNDRQAVLFHLESRHFYIFNLVLYPQDLIYLTGLLIVCAYALFLFTAVAGRLWCGYACPQTVYTEIYMWIEAKFEGNRHQRMKLDESGWTFEKVLRKGGKQAAWLLFGLWTGFTFVGYFTPIRELTHSALTLGFGPWEWFWILFYGFATYGNAGYMREQVCKYMCPYARFQGVMFDPDTLIISYDAERGEPRGSRSKQVNPAEAGLGSCIDCGLCVQVCPTGIDIRQGLQYECIGCAACIDACDGIMEKMNYPKGLIRYDTLNGMAQHLTPGQKLRRIFRPRVLVYTVILVIISVALLASLYFRTPFKVDVSRDRASLGRVVEDGYVENVYRIQIMNATEMPQRYRVQVKGLDQIKLQKPPVVEVMPAESEIVVVSATIPPEVAETIGTGSHKIYFEVESLATDGGATTQVVDEKSTFFVPR